MKTQVSPVGRRESGIVLEHGFPCCRLLHSSLNPSYCQPELEIRTLMEKMTTRNGRTRSARRNTNEDSSRLSPLAAIARYPISSTALTVQVPDEMLRAAQQQYQKTLSGIASLGHDTRIIDARQCQLGPGLAGVEAATSANGIQDNIILFDRLRLEERVQASSYHAQHLGRKVCEAINRGSKVLLIGSLSGKFSAFGCDLTIPATDRLRWSQRICLHFFLHSVHR